MLYGTPAPQPVPTGLADGQWQRGEWLVNGVGHCGACHTPKGSLGGDRSGHQLSGAQMPVVDWYAPPLRGLAGSLSQARFLSAGQSADRAVAGPMAHVVAGSLQHWTTVDVNAAVTYLTSLPKPAARVAIGNTISISALEFERSMTAGAKLYERHCKDCHGTGGEGRSQVYPALAGNVAVQEQPPTNAIRLTLNGGYPPSTAGNPMPAGMPPYRTVMSAQEIADTLTFIRKSWGAQGSVVTAVDVEKYRGAWIGNHHQ
jgi:mono/diheme cytochrome c family protein